FLGSGDSARNDGTEGGLGFKDSVRNDGEEGGLAGCFPLAVLAVSAVFFPLAVFFRTFRLRQVTGARSNWLL
ncbi:MAG: hypothetical protein JXB35_05710, partial [Anaerolineae bacterium]|nr:hypothetical protein [Anaerolineae bacterium]